LFPTMAKAITIKDIAKSAGVSVSTVSRYLNSSGYVNIETADKIKLVVDSLNYKPSRVAQSLKTKESKNIVFIVPDIQNPFYSKMMDSIQQLAIAEGYLITLFNTNESANDEIKYIQIACDIGADGIILASISTSQAVLRLLKKINIPTVLVNSYDSCPFDSVHGIRGKSTYLATQYLISLGHKRIGFAGGAKGTTIGVSRKIGYIKALTEANLTICEDLIVENGFESNSGEKSAEYFLGLANRPTAICCANDMIALGLIKILIKNGIQIPKSVSITGIDNIMYSSLCNPSLTTVTNDSTEFAKAAMEALIQRIRGIYHGKPREILIDRKLIIRESAVAIGRQKQ